MEVETTPPTPTTEGAEPMVVEKAPAKPPPPPLFLPETEVYLVTLAATTVLRHKKLEEARTLITALLGAWAGPSALLRLGPQGRWLEVDSSRVPWQARCAS